MNRIAQISEIEAMKQQMQKLLDRSAQALLNFSSQSQKKVAAAQALSELYVSQVRSLSLL